MAIRAPDGANKQFLSLQIYYIPCKFIRKKQFRRVSFLTRQSQKGDNYQTIIMNENKKSERAQAS